MKKFLVPATFIVALACAAFTLPASHLQKGPLIAYYNSILACTPYTVMDDNCVPDDLGYVCMEYTPDAGWQVMLQKEIGNTCYQPYYSYYPND